MKLTDALFLMPMESMGFVVIADDNHRPVGVFTDGNWRRSLDRDTEIKKTQISEVMNKDFVSITMTQIVISAVYLMERHKMPALPVIDEPRFITGALNMWHFFQAGVV